jgi:pSer/pThr/pTyr-binding forkhead associated (FHA) protein
MGVAAAFIFTYMPFGVAVEGSPTGLGAPGRKTGTQRRSPIPTGSPDHVGGRHPSSDIVLDDVTVSGRHAEFRWENNELHVVDVDSSGGTYVNRELVKTATLANGDEICIGSFRLVMLKTAHPPYSN